MESIVQRVFEQNFMEENQNNQVAEPEQPVISEKEKNEFDFDVKEARILSVGVGGAGNNCITRLHEMGIKGAQTVAINTDAKHLGISSADTKILLGKDLTKGLGAGGYRKV